MHLTELQTREHLLHHCSQWKYQHWELWKKLEKEPGWKAGRCQWAKESEKISLEICNKAVINFLAAMDLRQFPPG
jgi:hypothetical protein